MKSTTIAKLKKSLSFTVVLIMLASLVTALPVNAQAPTSGSCGENVSWAFDTDSGTLKIEGTGPMDSFICGILGVEDDLPWRGLRKSITRAEIGEGVTTVGDKAFYLCKSLESISLPSTVTEIGLMAFYDCEALKSITIPDSVKILGGGAFTGCSSLTEVTVPDSVEIFEGSMFYGCTALTYVKLPAGITSIPNSTFEFCDSLTEYTIPDTVTHIGDHAFSCCDTLEKVVVPDGVTYIGNSAFFKCPKLTDINIPDSVTHIDHHAFRECGQLKHIELSDNITNIGVQAFDCTWIYNNITNWTDGVLYIDNHLIKAQSSLSGEYTVREGTKVIAGEAFHKCTSLTGVVIPDSVTTIGYEAFRDCSAFESINESDNVSLIEYMAFYDTPYLAANTSGASDVFYFGNILVRANTNLSGDYVILDGTTAVSPSAFQFCENLTGIYMPESVKTVGRSAFGGCYSLTNVKLSGSLTEIAGGMFGSCLALKDLTLPHDITSIGSSAFWGCSSLESLYIPPSVTEFGGSVFMHEKAPVIYGAEGSPAQKWAQEKGYTFISSLAPFSDVPKNKWYYNAVEYATEKQLFNGISKTVFAPDGEMNRAMLVTVLWRMEGCPVILDLPMPFDDVSTGRYYSDAVLWAENFKIVEGVNESTFAPESYVTREQTATILYRYASYKQIDTSASLDTLTYPDSNEISEYAITAMSWANSEGLITGTKAGDLILLDPKGNATRAQMATILMRYLEKYTEA